MYKYQAIIWIPGQLSSFRTIVYADNDYQARQMLEAQYGAGSVMSYSSLVEG